MIMWKPTADQIDMSMIAGRAVDGLFSQSIGVKCPNVTRTSTWLSSPSSWYRNFHSSEITTMDVTTGTKYIVRKKLVPRTFALTSSARTRPKPACTGTMTSAKYKVLRKDAQNTESENRLVKFSNPTNSAGRGEMRRAFVKASVKARTTGMNRNST